MWTVPYRKCACALRCTVTRRDRSRARQVSEILASCFISTNESMSALNIDRRFSVLDLTGQVAQLCDMSHSLESQGGAGGARVVPGRSQTRSSLVNNPASARIVPTQYSVPTQCSFQKPPAVQVSAAPPKMAAPKMHRTSRFDSV